MLTLLQQVFADRMATPAWREKVRRIVPSYGTKLNDDPQALAAELAAMGEALQLAIPAPAIGPARVSVPGGGGAVRCPGAAGVRHRIVSHVGGRAFHPAAALRHHGLGEGSG